MATNSSEMCAAIHKKEGLNMLLFIIGFLLGGMIGVFIMSLMFAAKRADEHMNNV